MIRFLGGMILVILVILFLNLTLSHQRNNIVTESTLKKTAIEPPKKELFNEDRIVQQGIFKIRSYETAPVVGRTEIFIDQSINPILSLNGFYYDSKLINLDARKSVNLFLIQLNGGGKLLNSLVYRYQDGSLTRIPVSTEKLGGYLGTESSGGAEFIDIDKDGILEMLVYHRHYPPETQRIVELYKFNGEVLEKTQEYEEPMSEIYF